jgi:hypothetical protein
MHTRTAPAFTITLWLLGCSTPVPEAVTAVPPPEISFELPLERPQTSLHGKVCKLGDSCMAMDSRPFEACLVGARRCVDKANQPVEVRAPQEPTTPGVIETKVERAE